MSNFHENSNDGSTGRFSPELVGRLRTELLDLGESERYRLFSSLLAELAEHQQSSNNGRESAEQAAAVSKRLQTVSEEAATLRHEISTLKADLEHHSKQLASETARNLEFRKNIDAHRQQLDEFRRKTADLEAEVVAKNSALHKAETAAERFQLMAQRAEAAGQDMSRIDNLENEKRKLLGQVETLQKSIEQLRADKDGEIETLKGKVVATQSQAGAGADQLLIALWQRLARVKPALADGTVQPNHQAAERLFDAFIELANFANNFEGQLRPFMDRYTKHNETVSRPWKVYRGYEDILVTIIKTIAVQGGKPVGVLKMRLRDLNKWTMGALMGGDVAVESIAAELEGHLLGPAGVGENPNQTIRNFLRDDGHERFRDHMLEVRSSKLSDVHKLPF